MKGDFLATYSRHAIDTSLVEIISQSWNLIAPKNFRLSNIDSPLLSQSMPEENILSRHINFLRSDHTMFWYHNSRKYNSTLKAVLLTDTGEYGSK